MTTEARPDSPVPSNSESSSADDNPGAKHVAKPKTRDRSTSPLRARILDNTDHHRARRPLTSVMKDMFVSFALFVAVSIVTNSFGRPPFVFPASFPSDNAEASAENPAVPAAAAPANLRTQKALPPKPFFSPTTRSPYLASGATISVLDDYFDGNIYEAFAEADDHENALIM